MYNCRSGHFWKLDRRWKVAVLMLLISISVIKPASAAEPKPRPSIPEARKSAETAFSPAARMAWWREARFGLFIHWGLYAVPAGAWQGQQVPGLGEWIMHGAKIPVNRERGRF